MVFGDVDFDDESFDVFDNAAFGETYSDDMASVEAFFVAVDFDDVLSNDAAFDCATF